MAFDYKKEYKDLYQPKTMPAIVMVPAMRFVAVDGVGDPNEDGGGCARRRLRAQSRLPLDFDDSSAGIRDR